MKVKLLSRVQLLATPWTVAYQAPPSMGFSRQEYWSGLPLPSPSPLLESLKWTKSGSLWRRRVVHSRLDGDMCKSLTWHLDAAFEVLDKLLLMEDLRAR